MTSVFELIEQLETVLKEVGRLRRIVSSYYSLRGVTGPSIVDLSVTALIKETIRTAQLAGSWKQKSEDSS